MKQKILNSTKQILLILVGTFLMSLSTNLFLLPNKLSSGGVAGISTILYYLLNLPLGRMVFIINIPLFILAYFKLGKKFLLKTIISTIAYSIFVDILKMPIVTQDKLLASIYGGVILGIGSSLNFRAGSSTGGSDILAGYLAKVKPSLRLGEFLLIIDGVIILTNVIIFKNIEIGLYSVVTIYISTKLVDLVFEGIDFAKAIYIISDYSQEISNKITASLERGVTGFNGKGMYSNIDKVILLCVTTRNEIPKVKEIVREVDKNAFIIIMSAREVLGEGFKQ